MKIIFQLVLILSLTSCVVNDTLQDFSDERGESILKYRFDNQYIDYIDAKSSNKVLIKTKNLVKVQGSSDWGFKTTTTYKYYFSLNQDTFEEAVVEASTYCKLDNPLENPNEFCEVVMVNDFNANEVEQEFSKFLIEVLDEYFEITVKNLNRSRNCRVFETKDYKDFIWSGCEASIRYKLELPPRNIIKDRSI
tara:strand:+ start:150 stop:728 length:579 start_codon:yes stop_codon:yes gene_type:complete